MQEAQTSGVQRRPAQLRTLLAVEKIPCQRVAHVRQVDPNLVGPACLQLQPEQ